MNLFLPQMSSSVHIGGHGTVVFCGESFKGAGQSAGCSNRSSKGTMDECDLCQIMYTSLAFILIQELPLTIKITSFHFSNSLQLYLLQKAKIIETHHYIPGYPLIFKVQFFPFPVLEVNSLSKNVFSLSGKMNIDIPCAVATLYSKSFYN